MIDAKEIKEVLLNLGLDEGNPAVYAIVEDF